MRLALAQINSTVGDLIGNTASIMALIEEAREEKVDLIIFPELAITGYPPEDLLFKPQFIQDNLACLKKVVAASRNIGVFLGFADKAGKDIFNAAAFIENRKIKAVYHKNYLPNYAVFDEKRYFKVGVNDVVVSFRGKKIGLGICEDLWVKDGPHQREAKRGAQIFLSINASPYHTGKIKMREKLLASRAKKLNAYMVYVNLVGGQDELVFDGGSMVVDPKGKTVAACDQYREELLILNLGTDQMEVVWMDEIAEIYGALVLGVKDYVKKNGFSEVIIGLSGGIDSALTLVIAVDALGADKVHPVFMPSQYTADQSRQDAKKICDNLKTSLETISINDIFTRYLNQLAPLFKDTTPNPAEENLQARIRANFLMALSNKFDYLLLATGNKSEMSTGYCTLYGDMAGGFAPLKDVPKTIVYKLAEWRNRVEKIIPETIIQRPPTAELKLNQLDQDTLPPYEVLDQIMQSYVEKNKNTAQIIKMGIDPLLVRKAVSMIDAAEYKRRQAPPGTRITPRAFGKDWRLPITNRYEKHK